MAAVSEGIFLSSSLIFMSESLTLRSHCMASSRSLATGCVLSTFDSSFVNHRFQNAIIHYLVSKALIVEPLCLHPSGMGDWSFGIQIDKMKQYQKGIPSLEKLGQENGDMGN